MFSGNPTAQLKQGLRCKGRLLANGLEPHRVQPDYGMYLLRLPP